METQEFTLPNSRKLKVIHDCSPSSPREWDNVCDMIFIGKHSHLGDKHDCHETQESFEAHQEYVAKQLDVAFIAPVYAYIHSGMTISTEPFSCPWDSGKIGWVVMTKASLRENYGVKRVTQKLIEKAMIHVKGEIETLDQYIQGDVYGFKVVKVTTCDQGCDHEEEEDSCWGFYGSDISDNGILDHMTIGDQLHLKAELAK